MTEASSETRRGRRGFTTSGRLFVLLLVLFLLGVSTMIIELKGSEPKRAWEIYLVNLLFWSGISQTGVIFSAVMVMTRARWWLPLQRLAEGMASFLPLSFLLFLLLFLAGKDLYPWSRSPDAMRASWLNWNALVWRDLPAIALLYILSFVFLYRSVRRPKGEDSWRNRGLATLSPLIVVVYAFVYSLIAIDLVMSLSPRWYSTLFGGYFFIGNLYTGLAVLALLAVCFRSVPDRVGPIGTAQLHDLGKLLFAFCMITGDFFWSQFLVIWYGNIPEETAFVLRRIEESPWTLLSWAVLLVAFVLPFVILLSKKVKVRPAGLFTISVVILIGMWFERYVLIVPSVHEGTDLPLGWTELGITVGFLSLCLASYLVYLRFLPRIVRER